MARRTKRLWTDEEKRSICLQTTAPGVSVARVAQRYAMNAKPQDSEAGELVDVAGSAGTNATDGVWRDPDWLLCRDGRWRPVESGSFPLADGIPGRMGLLRGYGNAIVPPLAAEFVTAFLESLG
jgi:DNA (cytosine-5)-methyltransferase 1